MVANRGGCLGDCGSRGLCAWRGLIALFLGGVIGLIARIVPGGPSGGRCRWRGLSVRVVLGGLIGGRCRWRGLIALIILGVLGGRSVLLVHGVGRCRWGGWDGRQRDGGALGLDVNGWTEDEATSNGGERRAPDGGGGEGEKATSIDEPSAGHHDGRVFVPGGSRKRGGTEQAAKGPPAHDGGNGGVDEREDIGRERVADTGERAGEAEAGERDGGNVPPAAGDGAEHGSESKRDEDDGEQKHELVVRPKRLDGRF